MIALTQRNIMKKIIYNLLLTIALLLSTQLTATAASLGLTTGNPTLGSSFAFVDYLEFGGDGDLSSFFNPIDSSSGVTPVGFADLTFGVGFSLATPTLGATGFFDIFDNNGLFLGGDLLAVGFTQDVVELQFDNLIGSAAGSFGNSVLALVSFNDPLGSNPFNSFVDGDFYTASISISNVVSEPTVLSIFILALFLMNFIRFMRRNAVAHATKGKIHSFADKVNNAAMKPTVNMAKSSNSRMSKFL